MAELDGDYIVSVDEADLAAALRTRNRSVEDVLEPGAISARFELGHSLLVPTVVRGAHALPGGVTAFFDGRRIGEIMSSLRCDLAPRASTARELLDMVLEGYREQIAGSSAAVVLLSAGWDSRLELSLLGSALGSGGHLHAFHLFTSVAEEQIVTAAASAMGASLTVLEPGPLLALGLQRRQFRERASRWATWRPTTPMYAALLAAASATLPDVPAFGFVSYDLKGRSYDHPVTVRVPDSGKVRARAARAPVMGGADAVRGSVRRQQQLWTDLTRLSDGWPNSARRDHIVWMVRYGYTLGHRLQLTNSLRKVTPWHRREAVESFMGLPEESKTGTAFIRYALERTRPELLDIAVVASSGDDNHLTSVVGRDVDLGQGLLGRVREVPSSGPPPRLRTVLTVDRDEGDPYCSAFAPLAAMAHSDTGTALGRRLLEEGHRRGGSHVVNGLQLAEFLDSVAGGSSGVEACV
jgi:hypothetical protein